LIIWGKNNKIQRKKTQTTIITIQSSPDKAEKEDEEVATLTREEAASGLAIGSATDSGVNLYILAGHEAMQL